jgi:hypothetical protein
VAQPRSIYASNIEGKEKSSSEFDIILLNFVANSVLSLNKNIEQVLKFHHVKAENA